MVIQRIQTLFLLLAVGFMALFCLTPFATLDVAEASDSMTPVFVKDAPVYMILNIVIAVLLFLGIFMFKNLKLQMKITLASMVLICASIVSFGFVLYVGMPDAHIIWTGGAVLLVCALISTLLAYRGMKKDHRLLTSYDRLR
ncbi:MAG: DUF4293 domain-containing protein [Muribaculaceae bacterium]|nr:DUF4293 domain-containing protein [Muribaculaceae bacterium]